MSVGYLEQPVVFFDGEKRVINPRIPVNRQLQEPLEYARVVL